MIQKPKGTQDRYGKDGKNFLKVSEYIHNFMNIYNFEYINTPMFESSELFKRGVGETTDIVNKETYDFIDKGNRSMTLRPEVTAGVVRCFIENKLYANNEVNKYYYISPCFRYERPQNGRYREFYQFGVEVFGSDNPYTDSDVIMLAYKFLNNLGVKNLKVKINTLGNETSRDNYRKALIEYFNDKIDNLCETCKERYTTNPLRILDCKIDGENDILKNAPKTIDFLDETSKDFFNDIVKILENNGIPYEIDPKLVRGLDYYTHTVFEIVSLDKSLNNAATVCGGGRYNNLVESLGGPKVSAVGFGLGLERLLLILENEKIELSNENIDIYLMNLFNVDETYKLLNELREEGYKVETDFTIKPMKNLWKQVDKFNPNYIIILGEDEIKGEYITLKDNFTKDSIQIKRTELYDYLNVNL